MNNPVLCHAGQWMLNRRDFLRYGGTGLSAIALTALLSRQRLLALPRQPWRPAWSAERPHAQPERVGRRVERHGRVVAPGHFP